mgnify:CR=1 FL=1
MHFGNLRSNAANRYFVGGMLFARDKDRRHSQRYWVTVPVVIHDSGTRIGAVSINISVGGMYLFAAANLSPGTQVDIEFRLPDSKELFRARGTVRRRALYLYGIEFLSEVAASSYDRADAQAGDAVPS